MNRHRFQRLARSVVAFAVFAFVAGAIAPAIASTPDGKVPITTSSPEARALYLEGRNLAENLRLTDGKAKLEAAIAKDPSFALAFATMSTTAQTNQEFFDAIKHAVALAEKVTPGEKDLILGADAGARGDLKAQKEHYERLAASYPGDERAQLLLGGYHFGRQEYEPAVAHYNKAIALNPKFSPAYNQLGYTYRFLERYPDAEKAFRRYIELIPGDPNPQDSYAELLMKMGRFEDSILAYRKALALDPNFSASGVGIANNLMFLGRFEEARKTLAELLQAARNPGERRQALFWNSVSHVHQGHTDKALAELEKERAVAVEIDDKGSAAQDLFAIGNVLLESGAIDPALVRFDEAVATMEKADVPLPAKEAARRNRIYLGTLAALAKGDLPGATRQASEYGKQVAIKNLPFEVRQHHELIGRIALAEKDAKRAEAAFALGNQQDPRLLYHRAMAIEALGDRTRAREAFARAADFNALAGLNYAFVRNQAKAKVTELAAVAKGSR
jgi:tetratricopeptide (TPR) repeat protein